MKTDARNIYLRDWRKKRKAELEALRSELSATQQALEAARAWIETLEGEAYITGGRLFIEYGKEAYTAALARLSEANTLTTTHDEPLYGLDGAGMGEGS